MKIFYVYIYLDPRKPGNYKYEELKFNYEPIYIGKGKDKRDTKHLKRAENNILKNKINKILTEKKEPIIIRYKENLFEITAFDLETKLIKKIGRRDLGLGPLVNLTDGGGGVAGMKQNIESNKKRSDSLKNKPKSNQHCINIKTAKIGEKNPMFGVTSSKKGKTFEEIYGKEKAKQLKENLSEERKGKKHKKETKQKMSESRFKYLMEK